MVKSFFTGSVIMFFSLSWRESLNSNFVSRTDIFGKYQIIFNLTLFKRFHVIYWLSLWQIHSFEQTLQGITLLNRRNDQKTYMSHTDVFQRNLESCRKMICLPYFFLAMLCGVDIFNRSMFVTSKCTGIFNFSGKYYNVMHWHYVISYS